MDWFLIVSGLVTIVFGLAMLGVYVWWEKGSVLDPISATWVGFVGIIGGSLFFMGILRAERVSVEVAPLAVSIILLSAPCFAAGLYAGSGKALVRFLPRPAPTLTKPQVWFIWSTSAGWLVLNLAVIEGVPPAILSIMRGLFSGALGTLLLFSLLVIFTHKGSWMTKGFMVLSFIGGAVIMLQKTWSRRPLLGLMVAVAAYFYRSKLRHKSLGVRMTAMSTVVIMGIVLALFLTATRSSRHREGGGRQLGLSASVLSFIGGITINYEVFEKVIQYIPEDQPFLYGSGFVPAFCFLIPRSIWPSKPVSTGAIATYFWVGDKDYSYNVSIVFPGEAYMNFGFFGATVIMFIAGKLVRSLNTYMRENEGNSVLWLAWLMVWPDFASEWRGDFTAMTIQPTVRVATFIGLAWLAGKIYRAVPTSTGQLGPPVEQLTLTNTGVEWTAVEPEPPPPPPAEASLPVIGRGYNYGDRGPPEKPA